MENGARRLPPAAAPAAGPGSNGRQRVYYRLAWFLVANLGAIAFMASFEAIADYAGQVGWGPHMKYTAPLLVDTFTLTAGLVILARSEAGERAVYAWSLLIIAAGVSVGLNVAHAPDNTAAKVVAALPPAALLAAVELAMSEARRSRKPAPATPPAEAGERVPGPLPTVAPAPSTTPTRAASVPPARPAVKPAGRGNAPAERARAVRSYLAEHSDASANDVKKHLKERGIGAGESGAFYALVARVKSESNGHPEQVEVLS